MVTRNSQAVGQDIDSECRSCGMLLAHTIIAMVGSRVARVRCNTCRKEHAYRSPKSASEATAARRTAERKTVMDAAARAAAAPDFHDLAKGVDLSNAEKYSMKMALEKNSVVSHPKFGVGIVFDIRGDKAQVVFNAGAKTLVFGR